MDGCHKTGRNCTMPDALTNKNHMTATDKNNFCQLLSLYRTSVDFYPCIGHQSTPLAGPSDRSSFSLVTKMWPRGLSIQGITGWTMTRPHLPSSKISKLNANLCQYCSRAGPSTLQGPSCSPYANPCQVLTICAAPVAQQLRLQRLLASDNQISSDLHREAAQGQHTETALSSARCCCRCALLATLLRASSASAEPSAAVASSFRKQLLRSPPDVNSWLNPEVVGVQQSGSKNVCYISSLKNPG